MTFTTDRIAAALKDDVEHADSVLAEFTKNFKENPAYAFEWGDSAMRAAALKDVAIRLGYVLVSHANGMSEALDDARKELLRGALYPPSSTSAPSNLMATYKLRAFAEYVRKFGGTV